MSDSTGNHPYGGDQPPQNPYGQPPSSPPPQQPSPYGQQPGHGQQDPYGAQPTYGQQPAYGAQPPYGYGQPGPDPNRRPGTVMAAGVITIVCSGLTLALFALAMVALAVARDELVDQLRDEPGLENVDPNDLVTVMLVVFLVVIVWCAVAIVLAIFAMRRSNGARIGLVVSSAVVALLSLISIGSGLSAVSLIAAVAVIVCLFAGGAGQWYAGRSGGPTPSGWSSPVA